MALHDYHLFGGRPSGGAPGQAANPLIGAEIRSGYYGPGGSYPGAEFGFEFGSPEQKAVEAQRRAGLDGGKGPPQLGPPGGPPQGMAPEMPIPQLGLPGGAPPMPPMPAPAVGNPSEAVDMMFSGVPNKSPFVDRARSERSKNYGGYDPMTGIDWNTGRGGGK